MNAWNFRDYTVTQFLCPICKQPMFTEPDLTGVMVWCGRHDCPCPEVSGHAKNSKAAAALIQEKFSRV